MHFITPYNISAMERPAIKYFWLPIKLFFFTLNIKTRANICNAVTHMLNTNETISDKRIFSFERNSQTSSRGLISPLVFLLAIYFKADAIFCLYFHSKVKIWNQKTFANKRYFLIHLVKHKIWLICVLCKIYISYCKFACNIL